MAKERTTISLDGGVYAAALALCAPDKENRDFSNLCEMALREFLGARGAMPEAAAQKAELLATAEMIGIPAAIEQLRKKLRSATPSKTAA